jgi:hypothetical protein
MLYIYLTEVCRGAWARPTAAAAAAAAAGAAASAETFCAFASSMCRMIADCVRAFRGGKYLIIQPLIQTLIQLSI